jgi:hypothetical protein
MKTNDLIPQLDKVPVGRMMQASQKALIRTHLYFTGRTHELMLEYRDKAQSIILRGGGKDQMLDGSSGFGVQSDLLRVWGDTWTQWQSEFQQVRREAGLIAFGVAAVEHERLVIGKLGNGKLVEGIASQERLAMTEGIASQERLAMTEAVTDGGVFSPQLRMLLDIAAEYLYGDSMNLSGRIWKLDRESRDGINQVLMNGISSGDSAWNIAKKLEEFLGAGADCPRWTSTRLYGRSKSDIAAGDPTGLLSGDACAGQGVSYNALRLARTEIQKMHALATDRVLAAQPWVKSEQFHLSAAHPESDECDDAAKGGDNNDGVYPVGTIEIPLHPNCLCYKTAVQMPEKDFTSKLSGWVNGSGDWKEMDDYAQFIGGNVSADIMPAAINLAVWLFSDKLEEWLK